MYETISQGAASAQLPGSTLDRLSGLADNLDRANHVTRCFLDRFNGASAANAATVASVPSGHLGQIDRLETLIEEGNELASLLGSIG